MRQLCLQFKNISVRPGVNGVLTLNVFRRIVQKFDRKDFEKWFIVYFTPWRFFWITFCIFYRANGADDAMCRFFCIFHFFFQTSLTRNGLNAGEVFNKCAIHLRKKTHKTLNRKEAIEKFFFFMFPITWLFGMNFENPTWKCLRTSHRARFL